ncbi:putative C2 domain-containing protein [Medicago truncatula]|uniref:Calcium-dependent lipid-binding (CaLB domain) family protein n=2 Tax=Medicago truncatula TaxID=3880 RepID=G7JJZ3_MEDTR|nr:protein C2-DOMAIN ABA-RELATED 7 [Medicago truncatula]AES90103.1 calcium-dependent lipid-binding (CaLB domain) family protein [Medicago truncatula]RHN62113.1 putative C2 domain-containing protein [Medicago truncatula]
MANILGLIRLRIKKGTNLIPHDSRTSDPYVLVTMEEQTLKTAVVNDNCHPEWNEELTLYIKDVNTPIHLIVCDKDTFTVDDKMGEADIDIKPYLQCVKMGLSDLPDGHVVKTVQPDTTNCLAEESSCVWRDGKVVQEMSLRLRNVESGEVLVEIEWIDVTDSEGKGLSELEF